MCPILLHPETGERVNATHAGAAVLRERGYTDVAASTVAAPAETEATLDEKIDAMTGKQLDAYADDLGIADWNTKAKVPEKKAALKAYVPEPAEPTPLEDATDEQLNALADELGVELTSEEAAGVVTREVLIAAIRRTQAAESE